MGRYRSYTYNEYKRVMDMYKSGIGPTEISRKTGIKKYTVEAWIYEEKMPPLARWYPEPSKELAYIIGVLYGDGYIVKEHNYNYNIELKVKDYEFAEVFSRNMAKLLNKRYVKSRWHKSLNRWIVVYSSKAFYHWFREQTLETLKQYIEYSDETVASFLRGLYDSEGTNYRCKRIWLYNNDKDLLHYVQHLLKKYFNIVARGPYLVMRAGSINNSGIKTNYDIYYIAISREDSIWIFLSKIGFSITEKQLGLPRRKR